MDWSMAAREKTASLQKDLQGFENLEGLGDFI